MIPSAKSCTQRNQIQCKIQCMATFMSTRKTFTACTKEKLTGFLQKSLPSLGLPTWTGLAELRELFFDRACWMVSGLYVCL